MLVFGYSQDIKYSFLYLRSNGTVLTGKTLEYELVDMDRVVITSGTLSESSGEYYFTYPHSYAVTTNLNVRIKRNSKYIGSDQILIFEASGGGGDTQVILDAIDEADRYRNGETI